MKQFRVCRASRRRANFSCSHQSAPVSSIFYVGLLSRTFPRSGERRSHFFFRQPSLRHAGQILWGRGLHFRSSLPEIGTKIDTYQPSSPLGGALDLESVHYKSQRCFMVQAGTERSEARTYSTRCKPDQGSRRAVDERDDGRSMFLAADQWTVAFRLCNILFHAGHGKWPLRRRSGTISGFWVLALVVRSSNRHSTTTSPLLRGPAVQFRVTASKTSPGRLIL